MFGRLGRDAGSLLGVEFAPGSVRMLQLQRHRGQVRVKAWASQPLACAPGGAGSGDDTGVIKALVEAHRRCATGQRRVALALPSAQVICKTCPLPADLSPQQLEARLLAEADRLFPFPLDDLALDFQVLGPAAAEPGLVEALVVACRQSQLDPYEQLLARAGLELVAVDVDSFALRRALAPAPGPGTVLLQLEAGSAVAHRWGNGPLPQSLPLALASAPGGLDELSALLQRSLQPGDQLCLAGGAASSAGARHLAERLECPCRLLQLPPARGPAPGASMALAYGLAMGAWQ